MSNRHTSESTHPPAVTYQEPKVAQDFQGKVLLLRRREKCKICGRVHGPPQDRCDHLQKSPSTETPPDDLHLPWIF